MGSTDETTVEVKKLAAEAAESQVSALEERGYLDFDGGEQEDRMSVVRQLSAIIKSAIEKATEAKDKQLQSVVAFLETCKGDEWDRCELLKALRLTVPRAAHASEHGADLRHAAQEALVAIGAWKISDTQKFYAEVCDDLRNQFIKAHDLLVSAMSQRPTPATASEQEIGHGLTKRIIRSGERKPDSASTGKPPFGFECECGHDLRLHHTFSDHDECPVAECECTEKRPVAATPSGGGEWRVLQSKSHDKRRLQIGANEILMLPTAVAFTLRDRHNATLRDCGNDTKRLYHELLFAVVRAFPNESRHETALRYIRETEQFTENVTNQAGESQTKENP